MTATHVEISNTVAGDVGATTATTGTTARLTIIKEMDARSIIVKDKDQAVGSVEPVHPDRVLIVDDDPGIRRLLASALGFAGFQVDLAGDMTETLAKVSQTPPMSSCWM